MTRPGGDGMLYLFLLLMFLYYQPSIIILVTEPELVKNTDDSVWSAYGHYNNTSVSILQSVYPYTTAPMVFSEGAKDIDSSKSGSWLFTILECAHHPLDP